MESSAQTTGVSRKTIWIGRVISALPVIMMLMSGSMKLIKPPGMEDQFGKLGYYPYHILPLGILEIACVVLYVIPRTAVLGAILITGYLGGATATHVRV